MGLAETGQPFVVDTHHFRRGLRIVQPLARSKDAIEHFSLDAVAILVLDAKVRIGQSPDAFLAIVVEPGRRHAVGALYLTRDVLAHGGAHADLPAELRAPLTHPSRALLALIHLPHSVLHRRGPVGAPQNARHTDTVNVAHRRYTLADQIAHG